MGARAALLWAGQAGVRLCARVGGGAYLALHRPAVVGRWLSLIVAQRRCVRIGHVGYSYELRVFCIGEVHTSKSGLFLQASRMRVVL